MTINWVDVESFEVFDNKILSRGRLKSQERKIEFFKIFVLQGGHQETFKIENFHKRIDVFDKEREGSDLRGFRICLESSFRGEAVIHFALYFEEDNSELVFFSQNVYFVSPKNILPFKPTLLEIIHNQNGGSLATIPRKALDILLLISSSQFKETSLRELVLKLVEDDFFDLQFFVMVSDDQSSNLKPTIESFFHPGIPVFFVEYTENEDVLTSYSKVLSQYHLKNEHNLVIVDARIAVPSHALRRLVKPLEEDPEASMSSPLFDKGLKVGFPFLLDNESIYDQFSLDDINQNLKPLLSQGLAVPPLISPTFLAIKKSHLKKYGDVRIFLNSNVKYNLAEWSLKVRTNRGKHLLVPNLLVYFRNKSFGESSFESQSSDDESHQAVLIRNTSLEFVKFNILENLENYFLISAFSQIGQGLMVIFDHSMGGGANKYRKTFIKDNKDRNPILLVTNQVNCINKNFLLVFYYKDFFFESNLSMLTDVFAFLNRLDVKHLFLNSIVGLANFFAFTNFIIDLKKRKKSQLTLTMHEHYSICPSYTLLNKNGAFCDVPDVEVCQNCLPFNKYKLVIDTLEDYSDIERWRHSWYELFENANKIFCFSFFSKNLLTKTFPSLNLDKVEVKYHQVDYLQKKNPKICIREKLIIGILGILTFEKGSQIIVEMIKTIKQKKLNIGITIIGYTADEYISNETKVTGVYRKEKLPQILEEEGINICFVPSICPETFSFVAEEIMTIGHPLAAFNLGGIPERLQHYKRGLIIEKVDAQFALEKILLFADRLKNISLKNTYI